MTFCAVISSREISQSFSNTTTLDEIASSGILGDTSIQFSFKIPRGVGESIGVIVEVTMRQKLVLLGVGEGGAGV